MRAVSTFRAIADWLAMTYHLRRLRTTDGELEVGILLPVAKEERKPREKSVVCVSSRCDRLWAGVAVEAAFLCLCRAHELFPVLELFGLGELSHMSACTC